MKLKLLGYTAFWLLLFSNLSAQTISLSGYVLDSLSQEALINATISSEDNRYAAVTNEYGFFSLKIPLNTSINIRYIGYAVKKLDVKKDEKLTILLSPFNELQEVTIKANQDNYIENGRITLPIDRLKAIPSLAGEVDILKALQFMPGVLGGVEGTSNIYVRGGTPDQNLILLDGATVYNTSHLFGFLSVFNPSAIKSVNLLKGNFPARYGGRLSSVLEVNMKEGNNQKKARDLSIGLISSSFTFESPIKKDKSSFIISGRMAYPGALAYLSFLNRNNSNKMGYFMYDLNAKINHQISAKDHVFASLYFGKDKLNSFFKDNTNSVKNNLEWGNQTASVRYTKALSNTFFAKTQVTYNGFSFNNTADSETDRYGKIVYKNSSNIKEYSINTSLDCALFNKHFITFGASFTQHFFEPNSIKSNNNIALDSLLQTTQTIQTGKTLAVFLEDSWKISKNIELIGGLRGNQYMISKQIYAFLEPRVMLKTNMNKNISFYAFYSKVSQFVHLLTSNGVGLSNDIWVPSTEKTPPQRAWIASIGTDIKIPSKNLSISVEAYYKEMKNQIDYRQGVNIFFNNVQSWEDIIERNGIGKAKGFELFIKKEEKKWDALLSYTLSWSDRKFENINNNTWYPLRFDRRHNLTLTGTYKLSDKWTLSANWVYNTGIAVTLPSTGQLDLLGRPTLVFGDRNNGRMPDYHRLDVSLIKNYKNKYGNSAQLILGLYNAYGRANPFYMDYALTGNSNFNITTGILENTGIAYTYVKSSSLFRFIPSISYNVKF